jgi:hypothetical protein
MHTKRRCLAETKTTEYLNRHKQGCTECTDFYIYSQQAVGHEESRYAENAANALKLEVWDTEHILKIIVAA